MEVDEEGSGEEWGCVGWMHVIEMRKGKGKGWKRGIGEWLYL